MAQEVRKMKGPAGEEEAEYNMIDIANMFLDQCDRAKVIPVVPVASQAPPSQPEQKVAMMHTRPTGRFSSLEQVSAVVYHRELQAVNIPIIDPYTDPGVWAIVDDGCNSCCFSDAWKQNADWKWRIKGFAAYLKSSVATSFNGVGTSTTAGKYVLPFGLRLEPSFMSLPGLVEGHKIIEGDRLLLLSQSVQAKLGMVKDVRDGTTIMKDYQGQHLQVARQIRTGLLMVRIDHLSNVEDYLNPD